MAAQRFTYKSLSTSGALTIPRLPFASKALEQLAGAAATRRQPHTTNPTESTAGLLSNLDGYRIDGIISSVAKSGACWTAGFTSVKLDTRRTVVNDG